jgi:amino acid transporter
MEKKRNIKEIVKNLIIGKSRSPTDKKIFHKLSLIAFFAWVGLGADGLSSSCYGPSEAFLTLGNHPYLAIFVGLGTVLTILVISTSYSQIVELFPTGGGGYLVASKLLSPTLGMISGCALLIDYVLTITVSIASGADAVFSLLPLHYQSYKLGFAILCIAAMILLNVRGVKESVIPLVPIFIIFLLTHVFIVLYGIFTHLPNMGEIVNSTGTDVRNSVSQFGLWGVIFLILRAYSMGAGTFTGIEAVSNGIPVLREPRVETAKRTMHYMAISLSFIVMGLMISYLLFHVQSQPGKTLNAIFFENATTGWGQNTAVVFIFIALMSEAVLLCIAAQAGFLDGPRVLANMALDQWFPTKFASLSDRLVTQNGILIMGGLSILLMIGTNGSVGFLVVLYSINVFITFVLSQLGMVRHWWIVRHQAKPWFRKILINGTGLILSAFILLSMIVFKFSEGGWITLLITGALIALAVAVKRHYHNTGLLLQRLNQLVKTAKLSHIADMQDSASQSKPLPKYDPDGKTAVLLVSGFNGTGLHTLFNINRLFGGIFKNFVFIEVGILDVGNFKGVEEVEHLKTKAHEDTERYVKLVNKEGYYAEAICEIGVDIIGEIDRIAPQIYKRYPNSVFFGGQLVFPKDSFLLRFLHNYIVFTLQKRLYRLGIPFVILPIRVY